jgi:hypothetical protein
MNSSFDNRFDVISARKVADSDRLQVLRCYHGCRFQDLMAFTSGNRVNAVGIRGPLDFGAKSAGTFAALFPRNLQQKQLTL